MIPNKPRTESEIIARFVLAGRKASAYKPACIAKWGWSFCLNQSIPGHWTFSAKLPPGRSSARKDWERLGRVVGLVYDATGHARSPGNLPHAVRLPHNELL